jgi:hypothetical protein
VLPDGDRTEVGAGRELGSLFSGQGDFDFDSLFIHCKQVHTQEHLGTEHFHPLFDGGRKSVFK